MKNSCGAIFYTYDPNGNLGIILGSENGEWLPFKGCNEEGETFNQTAIREINEETCGLINIKNIILEHKFTSKRKHYHIGLCQVNYDIIEKFNNIRNQDKQSLEKEFLEKEELKFFDMENIISCRVIHNISKSCINYYMCKLQLLKNKQSSAETKYTRKHSMSVNYLDKYLATYINLQDLDSTEENTNCQDEYPQIEETSCKKKVYKNYNIFNMRYYLIIDSC